MVFTKKTKGYFVEHNSHSVLLASTSARTGPMVVEELNSCPTANTDALDEMIKQLRPKKSGQHGYLHATCGVYTEGRLLRHVSLDPKRYKEPSYMDEVLANQIHIEADKYTLALLGAKDGLDFDFDAAGAKDAVVVGLRSDEVVSIQNTLLQRGLYPERLEVGTLDLAWRYCRLPEV
ncbi:MAG: hypothetical protein QM715_06835 [Nibricoccus sp.]